MFGSKKALFERVVRAYSTELYRYGYWLCRDRFVAEDLVQETFTRAWASWAALRDEHAVKAWLYTILRREHARLFERKRLDIADEQELDLLVDDRLTDLHGELEMREALAALPRPYREPLLLQVLGGFSSEEIAGLMGLTPGAVMTRLSRARLALRRRVGGEDGKEASA